MRVFLELKSGHKLRPVEKPQTSGLVIDLSFSITIDEPQAGFNGK